MSTSNSRSIILSLVLAVVIGTPAHAELTVLTDKLFLVSAAGVPDQSTHDYILKGSLRLKSYTGGVFSQSSDYKDFTVTVEARWDGDKKRAVEFMDISAGSDGSGKLNSEFSCDKDPWLSKSSCIVVSSQLTGGATKLTDLPAIIKARKQPLTIDAVSLTHASVLSKDAAKTPVPPPPAPVGNAGAEPAPQQRLTTESATGGVAAPMPGGGFAPPLVAKADAGGVQPVQPGLPALPLPDLKIALATATVQQRCQSGQPVLLVDVSVANQGGGAFPAMAQPEGLQVRDSTGNTLNGVAGLPMIAASGMAKATVAVQSSKPLSMLAGKHNLQVVVNAGKKTVESDYANNTHHLQVEFARDYCMAQRGGATTPMTRMPASTVPPAGGAVPTAPAQPASRGTPAVGTQLPAVQAPARGLPVPEEPVAPSRQ